MVEAEILREMVNKYTVKEIAEKCSVAKRTVYAWLKKCNIELPKETFDIDRLKELLEGGATVKKAAMEMQIPEHEIYKQMQRNGLHTKRARLFGKSVNKDLATLGKEISNALSSNEHVCRECGKIFYIYNVDEWVFKSGGEYYCKWSCFEKAKKRRKRNE